MLTKNNYLYKPSLPYKKEWKEYIFYESIKNKNKKIQKFIPKYYGIISIIYSENDKIGKHKKNLIKDHLVLENLVEGIIKLLKKNIGYELPCLMDMKIGKRTYDEDATESKIKKEIEKYPQQERIGIRVCGIKKYNVKEKEYQSKDTKYGRSLDENTIIEAFKFFLFDGIEMRKNLVVKFIERLKEFILVMENQNEWRFYGSSVLLIYDGNVDNEKIDLRWIDFARTFPIINKNEIDESVLFGLNNLLKYLESFL
jgi:hypothetical protein